MSVGAMESTIRTAVRMLERARSLRERGRLGEARRLAMRARGLLEAVLASRTASPAEKMVAKAYLGLADDLLAEPGRPVAESDGGVPGDSGLEAYIERARSFISRASVSWDDIVGLEGVKERLVEALYFSIGVVDGGVELEVPRRFLLYGPPGTGKTLLAAAASATLGATFIDVPVSGILSKYVGDSPKMVSAVFRLAEAEAPSVVFFDEVDALAVSRDSERQPATGLVQALLQELDGVRGKGPGSPPVIVIAATNKPWLLDEAFRRRFDLLIYVPPPGRRERAEIIRVHTVKRGIPLAEDVDLEWLADATEGYTGSDLRRLVAEAVRLMLVRANPQARDPASLGKGRPRIRVEPLTMEDFRRALQVVKPSISREVLKAYEWFRSKYGG